VNRQAQGGKKPARSKQKESWRVNRQALGGNRQEAQEEETARMMKSCRFLFLWQKKREFLGGFTFSLYLCTLNYARAIRAHVAIKD
jgi:hypothetical protein